MRGCGGAGAAGRCVGRHRPPICCFHCSVASIIFLESPAGVGFSHSNTSSDYRTGAGLGAAPCLHDPQTPALRGRRRYTRHPLPLRLRRPGPPAALCVSAQATRRLRATPTPSCAPGSSGSLSMKAAPFGLLGSRTPATVSTPCQPASRGSVWCSAAFRLQHQGSAGGGGGSTCARRLLSHPLSVSLPGPPYLLLMCVLCCCRPSGRAPRRRSQPGGGRAGGQCAAERRRAGNQPAGLPRRWVRGSLGARAGQGGGRLELAGRLVADRSRGLGVSCGSPSRRPHRLPGGAEQATRGPTLPSTTARPPTFG